MVPLTEIYSKELQSVTEEESALSVSTAVFKGSTGYVCPQVSDTQICVHLSVGYIPTMSSIGRQGQDE